MTRFVAGLCAAVGVLVAVAPAGCSRASTAPDVRPVASTTPATAPASASAATGGTFGAFCVDNSACASGVCFHKRVKGANPTPERRGAKDEVVEHDGYCSMHCNADSDCPTPPSSGRCGARGMCKRAE
jgi:hypothetical protein